MCDLIWSPAQAESAGPALNTCHTLARKYFTKKHREYLHHKLIVLDNCWTYVWCGCNKRYNRCLSSDLTLVKVCPKMAIFCPVIDRNSCWFWYYTLLKKVPFYIMKVEKVLVSFDSRDMIRKKVWILMNGSLYFEGTTPSAMSRLIHLRMLIVMFSIRLINCLPVINKREKNLKQLLNRKYFCRLAS